MKSVPPRGDSAPFLDAANLLTLSRIPLGALILLNARNRKIVLSLIAAAGVTDMLDGWVARRDPRHSQAVGAWLDPLCDKAFVLSVLAANWRATRPPAYVPALVAMRELIQIPALGIYFIRHRNER